MSPKVYSILDRTRFPNDALLHELRGNHFDAAYACGSKGF